MRLCELFGETVDSLVTVDGLVRLCGWFNDWMVW